ncbi:MAG: GGDEF domain-containing protein [Lachnospiraceae bacterium]|nr:GGDEF domain-containing protein [Lachnospiraceae bacterium]
MSAYFIYYASFNLVGIIIFGIMLAHDRLSIDRQEKQLKYDHTLIAFMLYFLSDAIWAGVDSGVFPVNSFTVLATGFSNFVIMTAITYTWLRYVMAVEQIPNRNEPRTRFAILFPFLLSVIALIVTYLVAPNLLIDENNKTTNLFDVFLVTIPYVYVIAVIVYTVKKAVHEKSAIMKRRHIYIGFFPIMVVVGGLMQMILMPELPIFCFGCIILMIIFYIQSMDSQISTDPLTKLNNRGQLSRYLSQPSNLRMEGRKTYVVMVDVNDFKMINDTYGHAEGDAALVILAQALVNTVRSRSMPMFLGRYGGDEFVLIAHPVKESELEDLVRDLRSNVQKKCESEKKQYIMSVGIGYDEFLGDNDVIQKCMQRADSKLYLDKEYCKLHGKSTICN